VDRKDLRHLRSHLLTDLKTAIATNSLVIKAEAGVSVVVLAGTIEIMMHILSAAGVMAAQAEKA